jgi:hypothetical protein
MEEEKIKNDFCEEMKNLGLDILNLYYSDKNL